MENRVLIIHVIAKLELGGAQRVVLETIKRLDSERFESVLITGSQGPLVEEAKSLRQVKLHFLRELKRELDPWGDLIAVLKIRNILRREVRSLSSLGSLRPEASGLKACISPPIIVHTHGSKAGLLGRIAARLAGMPVVFHTVHGFAFHDFQPKVVKRAIVIAERLCAKFTTLLIAVSTATREKGLREKIGDRSKYTVLYPGAVLDEFVRVTVDLREKKRELGLHADLPVVGTISCFKPQKAPLDFVKVAARVLSFYPDVQFVAVGDGVLRGEVERLSERLGVRGKVHLLGWRTDVPQIVPLFDVFLLTSLWEGLPIVFAETMSQGIPSVATRVDGTPEAVIDGVTGFLAPAHGVEALAEKVLVLLRDREMRLLMGDRGRERAGKFDIGRMVTELEKLYLSLSRTSW